MSTLLYAQIEKKDNWQTLMDSINNTDDYYLKHDYIFKAKEYAIQKNNDSLYMESIVKEIEYYFSNFEFEKGYYLCDTLVSRSSEYFRGKGNVRKAIYYCYHKNPEQAISMFKQGLIIANKYNDEVEKAVIYSNLGNIYAEENLMDDAIKNYKIAEMIYLKLHNEHRLGSLYSNYSKIYLSKGQIDSAHYFNEKLSNISKKLKNYKQLKYHYYTNNAYILSEEKKTIESLKNVEKAKIYALEMGNKMMQASLYQIEALILESQNRNNDALEAIETTLKLIKDKDLSYFQLRCLIVKERLLYKLGFYKEAYKLSKEISIGNEELNNNGIEHKLKEMNYENEIKDRDYKILHKEYEIQKKQIRINDYIKIVFLLLSVFIMSFSYIYWKNQKIVNKIKLLKNEKNLAILKSTLIGEEKERIRISRELHDSVGVLLSVAKIKTSNINIELDDENTILKTQVLKILDKASDEVRNISHALRIEEDINNGLRKGLLSYVESLNESLEIEFVFNYIGDDFIDESLSKIIYRIVQELTNNVIKHSKANICIIQIHHFKDRIILTIEDDGVGFDKANINKGIGIQNVYSRLEELDACMDIKTEKGKGSTFEIIFNI